MRLQRLVLSGFKTFAHRTEIRFEPDSATYSRKLRGRNPVPQFCPPSFLVAGFAQTLLQARQSYRKVKEYDDALFGQDFSAE